MTTIEQGLAALDWIQRHITGADDETSAFGEYVATTMSALTDAQAEIQDGDYWKERAKQYFANGGCPICFATDEAGHLDSCPWGNDEAEIARLTALSEQKDRAMERLAGVGIRSCSTCPVPHENNVMLRKCFHDRSGRTSIQLRISAAMEAAKEEGGR